MTTQAAQSTKNTNKMTHTHTHTHNNKRQQQMTKTKRHDETRQRRRTTDDNDRRQKQTKDVVKCFEGCNALLAEVVRPEVANMDAQRCPQTIPEASAAAAAWMSIMDGNVSKDALLVEAVQPERHNCPGTHGVERLIESAPQGCPQIWQSDTRSWQQGGWCPNGALGSSVACNVPRNAPQTWQ